MPHLPVIAFVAWLIIAVACLVVRQDATTAIVCATIWGAAEWLRNQLIRERIS